MEFVLIYEWMDEESGYLYENWVKWFDTKEELLEAYHNARMEYIRFVEIGRLHLHAAVHYCWADIENNF